MSSGGNWKEMFDAACAGDEELVRYHVRHGVDVNYAHPEFLSTPLVASILAGREAVAHLLLDSGADASLGSEFDGMVPLQAALRMDMPALAARLEAAGARLPPPALATAGTAATAAICPWWRRLFG